MSHLARNGTLVLRQMMTSAVVMDTQFVSVESFSRSYAETCVWVTMASHVSKHTGCCKTS